MQLTQRHLSDNFCPQRFLTALHDKCLFQTVVKFAKTERSEMSHDKEKTNVCSAKSAVSDVPAEWKVLKKIHSDPLVERLIQAAQRENVATEMIAILGYDKIISLD